MANGGSCHQFRRKGAFEGRPVKSRGVRLLRVRRLPAAACCAIGAPPLPCSGAAASSGANQSR